MGNSKFEIIDSVGTIATLASGHTLELNLVSWNNRLPMYEIRYWTQNHEKPLSGVFFTEEQLRSLASLLNKQCGFLTEE